MTMAKSLIGVFVVTGTVATAAAIAAGLKLKEGERNRRQRESSPPLRGGDVFLSHLREGREREACLAYVGAINKERRSDHSDVQRLVETNSIRDRFEGAYRHLYSTHSFPEGMDTSTLTSARNAVDRSILELDDSVVPYKKSGIEPEISVDCAMRWILLGAAGTIGFFAIQPIRCLLARREMGAVAYAAQAGRDWTPSFTRFHGIGGVVSLAILIGASSFIYKSVTQKTDLEEIPLAVCKTE